MELLALRTNDAVEYDALLPWHKPEVRHLVVSVNTDQVLKNGSTEDTATKANNYPAFT